MVGIRDSSVNRSRLDVVRALAAAGCVAPADEADELIRAAHAGVAPLDEILVRRERGEPLAWIVGSLEFCGLPIRVEPGVYVPRAHTEPLARRAASLLPEVGVAVDLCTGSGAVAAVMHHARPAATVLGTDIDQIAVACATSNGITALRGDLDDPLPVSLVGLVDVMTAVVPYVPREEMHLLPRDVIAFEPHLALDGGPGGTRFLERVARLSVRWLRRGGHLLLEIGGDQARVLEPTFRALGLSNPGIHRDAEGHDRAIELTLRNGR
ncbi:MAG TPA: HemK/PrmC family methyltransferase [Actinomycetota bacterium]|jgi:release factor glutamine methyltransferase|nr:HemK/PrmC family methyltransferase [Actinomycetota bacterium]